MTDELLLQFAERSLSTAYAPYSGFAVAAAIITSDGKIFCGVNVESASYGLSCCAERVALYSAVSQGHRSFSAIAVAADVPVTPCGACRQALYEFSPSMRVITRTAEGKTKSVILRDYLPDGFTLKPRKSRTRY